jgi:hypothetical protein
MDHAAIEGAFRHSLALHCKKSHFPVPSRDVTDQTLSVREKTKLFPPMKSLISDIPAGDGKTANPFLQCSRTPPHSLSLSPPLTKSLTHPPPALTLPPPVILIAIYGPMIYTALYVNPLRG